MRRSLPRLAYLLSQDETLLNKKFGEIAEEYDEEIGRIMDALDLLKVMRGEYREIPDIPWEYPYNL